MASLSVVIVSHDSRAALASTLPVLEAQLRDGDELIVVDNGSADGSGDLVRELVPAAKLIETGANPGFAAGCNRGVEAASGELVCLLNPDAVPQAGWREAIERPLAENRGWAAWQALVTGDGGTTVNTRGGVVHFTGISWAGGAGEPLANQPKVPESIRKVPGGTFGASDASSRGGREPAVEPGFVSGACLVLPRARYLALGGMPEPFFLYHEDVDLSLRLRLAGGRLGVEPSARVDHDYEFEKGAHKWRYLERNRWATLIRTYPGALLLALAPALVATELALLVAAAAGGWLPQKLRASAEALRALPRLLGERRSIQGARTIGAGEFARGLTAELDSAYLGAAAHSPALGAALRLYWSLVLFVLGARRR